jgi:hypothetical protein
MPTCAGIGIAHEQPVLFPKGGGPDGVFHEVVVDLHPAVAQINVEAWPFAQCIIEGDAQ